MIEQGSLQAARSILADMAEQQPACPEIRAALGKVCSYQQDYPTAVTHLEQALQADPYDLETLFNLGYVYGAVGRYEESIDCLRQLKRHTPQLPALYRWEGVALDRLGRGGEALQAFQEALRLKPDYDEALAGLGNLLFNNKQMEKAERYLQRAVTIAPEKSAYHNDLGRVYRQQGRMEEAVACYRKALELEPSNFNAASNILYGLCYLDTITPESRAEEHRTRARHFYPVPEKPAFRLSRKPAGSLRHIGYVSGDFGTHSVAYFLEPILRHHDRRQFKIFCYSNRGVPDETTNRIKGMDLVWRDIMGVPAKSAAAQIAQDGIDILVDLSGHTAGHRLDLFALKPAPVQVSWIGYPHSTGLAQIDYYLSDNRCDPPGMTDQLYTEQVWRLPRVFSCYAPPMAFPAVAPAPFQKNGYITFGSFNSFAKVNHRIIQLWSALLHKVPGSRLVLKSASLGGSRLQQSVYDQFAAQGITRERIGLMPYAASTQEHLSLYHQVDIALDTYPYHGTTTTCEALWMGVPVVTLAGTTHLSRVGVSFLSAAGINELIAKNPDEYVSLASELAAERQRLIYLRENLRSMMALSPLMDAKGFTLEWERALIAMHKKNNDPEG